MPVTAETETQAPEKRPVLVWLLPVGLLVVLLGVVVRVDMHLGPVGLGTTINATTGYPQGVRYNLKQNPAVVVLRVGDWHWGIGIKR